MDGISKCCCSRCSGKSRLTRCINKHRPSAPAKRFPDSSCVRKDESPKQPNVEERPKQRAFPKLSTYDPQIENQVLLETSPTNAAAGDILAHGKDVKQEDIRKKEASDDPILGEEAKLEDRLRKRKVAEGKRLLDMERRQKQRVEEFRNARKKDEENTSLKDTIRAEVRETLGLLEMSSNSISSALHLMGIHVNGWPHSSPKDIQQAFKKALIAFHPDRVSKLGIAEQVEAEEKFKFVNHLKEKFNPSL